jgi:hypothetical protein
MFMLNDLSMVAETKTKLCVTKNILYSVNELALQPTSHVLVHTLVGPKLPQLLTLACLFG